jgi:hypothetical protein
MGSAGTAAGLVADMTTSEAHKPDGAHARRGVPRASGRHRPLVLGNSVRNLAGAYERQRGASRRPAASDEQRGWLCPEAECALRGGCRTDPWRPSRAGSRRGGPRAATPLGSAAAAAPSRGRTGGSSGPLFTSTRDHPIVPIGSDEGDQRISIGGDAGAALVFEAAKIEDAIAFDMAWQTLFGGLPKSAPATTLHLTPDDQRRLAHQAYPRAAIASLRRAGCRSRRSAGAPALRMWSSKREPAVSAATAPARAIALTTVGSLTAFTAAFTHDRATSFSP